MDVLGGAPSFLACPRPSRVPSGADAVLRCQVVGDSQPSVVWEDRLPLAPPSRLQAEAEGSMCSLSLSHRKARNAVRETCAEATLTADGALLQQAGDPEDAPPLFLSKPASRQVCRGEDVGFACRLSGHPCPTLRWEKDGRQLPELFESSRFSLGREPDGWHFLKLFGARPPDGGVYVCRAQNRAGEALAAAVLLVEPAAWGLPLSQGGKQLEPRGRDHGQPARANGAPQAKAFAVSEGKHAKFRCYVTGKPKPEVLWQKDGQAVAPGRRHLVYEDREGYFTLKVLYCKAGDQGLYVCTASNAAGQTLSAVQLRVREPRVRFQVHLVDVEVQERQDAVLECQVPLETIPTAWYLEDTQLQPSPKYVMEEQGPVRRLTIRDARTDDDGVYLCRMQQQGRSIAELSVRGVIVKRLPRKLDVMEGENAAFCVETRDAVEGPCWRHNGLQLQEAPCTVLKSFGKTHLLVLVHVSREDAGVVSFAVGEAQTSAQLRVKCAKRVPPSAPVAAEMSTARSNAALLTWCPGPGAHRSPPSSYVLERQEASAAEWVQCLTTDLASMVEVLGDSVPAEADYCFRICAVNKYGRSRPVEFPGSVHLVPVACVRRGLQDVQVQAGQDACFSLELSAAVAGTWLLDGARLEETGAGQRYTAKQSGTEHSLLLRGVRLAESGAQVGFVASGVRSVATLQVQEPPVRIVSSNEAAAHAYVSGARVVLACELSRPDAPAHWYKDGLEVEEGERLCLEREGPHRRLLIPSARPQDTGEFVCDAGGDSVFYSVSVTAPQVCIAPVPEAPRHRELLAGLPLLLQCELSVPEAPAHWLKDGEPVEADEEVALQAEGCTRRLFVRAARPAHSGTYTCAAGLATLSFTVAVAEPPVRIVSSNEAAAHAYVSGARVVLACELSRPDAPAHWYKDGLEVEEGERLRLEREGPHRRLLIPSARPQDTGEFVCDAGGDSVFYSVSVTEPPVRILRPLERAQERWVLAPEALELRCEVSRAEAQVRWFKDGLEVEEAENLLLRAEGAQRWLRVPQTRAQDAGEYVCEAGDEAVSFDVRVSEPPVRILQPRRAPPALRAALGETVTLACELSRGDVPVQWEKDGARLEAGGSLILEEEGAVRRLVIPAAGPEHAGKYVCRAADDARTFAVQVSEPPVTILGRGELQTQRRCRLADDLVLEVRLSQAHGQLKWYKDGEKLQDTGRVRLEEDGARRSLVILGVESRDAGEYLCDSHSDSLIFYVTVEEPQVSVVRSRAGPERQGLVAGEDLVLACEVSRPSAAVRWLRDGQELVASERVRIEAQGTLRQLTLLGAQPGDSGSYVCDAASDRVATAVEVAAPPVRVVNKEAAQVPVEVLEGESVTLVARISQEQAPVRWLKNKRVLGSGARLLLGSQGPSRSLTIQQTEPGDSGTFSCDTGDDEVHFTLRVREAPVLFVNKQARPEKLLVLEGGSAVLSAIVSKEQASVSWRGPERPLEAGPRCELRQEGRVHSLVLSNVGKADAGLYTCLSRQDQLQFDLSVKELPVKFVRGLSDVQAHVGEPVLLWCELCKPRGQVVWLKDGRELAPSPGREMKAEGRERSLALSSVGPEDAGEYSCESKDDRTLAMLTVQVPRRVEIISDLHSLTVLEGEDATFKCLVSPEDVALTWQLSGRAVAPSERLLVSRNGLCHALTLRRCQLGDAATVAACAEGVVSTARLSVQEAQVRFVRRLQDVRAEELQDVELEVELSCEAGEVQWLKQGVLVQPGSKYQLREAGRRRGLTIRRLSPSDRGTYRCESLHDRTQARLSVEPRKVSVRKPLSDVETFEKETATLQLELSHADVPGLWTRDGIRVKPSRTCRVSATGCVHSLTLLGLTLQDSGTITFTADTLRSSARLTVRELPVAMVKAPRDVGVPETGAASFECELSRALAEVKWYKDGAALRVGPRCRIYSVGRRRLLQLSHCRLEDAGEYVCDAGDCRAAARLRVYERLVQIVQELADVHVREDENAVFTCQVSHEDVKGEWFRGSEKIKATSTVKIRQEGPRHFLLICSVRPEDAGRIRFVAKAAASEASLHVEALPIRIVKPLRDKTALARHKATLECTVSHARGRVRWFRGDTEIFASDKYEICNLDCYRTLVIHWVGPDDEASYTCDAFDDRSSARLLVEGH